MTGEPTTGAPTLYELRELQRQLLIHAKQIPDELYGKLRQLLDWLVNDQPWSMQLIHMHRWFWVREGLSKGYNIVDESVGEYAAEKAANTPAKGAASTMITSYWWMERRCREVM